MTLVLPIVWISWWLWAVNWRRTFPVLVSGAWAPLVLLILVSALVWSRIAPSRTDFFGVFTLANFWWQLEAVSLYVGIALFCGYLQLYFQWSPPEVSFDPPTSHEAHGHDAHGHDSHGHGSSHAHSSADAAHH